MKLWPLQILFFSLLLYTGCGTQKAGVSKIADPVKPNILLIHIDDLGYHDLSINGSAIYQTPNIDRLARESIQFENAYANFPRCVPSRFAMMTASWPMTSQGVPDDGFEMNAVPDEKNLINKINEAGYHTAFFGKWHLGSGVNGPKGFGFDYSLAAGEAGSPISYFFPFNEPSKKHVNTNKSPIPDVDEIGKEGDFLNDLLTDKVIEHIKNNSDKPFFVSFDHYAVHQPIEAKEKDILRNKKQIEDYDFGNQPEYIKEGTGRTKMRQDNATYAGLVENMDENVGRLLKFIKDFGLEGNTIIIFSSDHGGLSNDGLKERNLATSNFPLRAGKGWLYDGGTKVPLFIKYPKFKPRKESKSIVMLMDILPTILDFASGEKVSDIDGKSLLPLIQQQEDWSDRTVYWHSDKARPRNTGESNASAIRSGKWKLIDFYEKNHKELFNMEEDQGESQDLGYRYPQIRDSLSAELNHWKSTYQ